MEICKKNTHLVFHLFQGCLLCIYIRKQVGLRFSKWSVKFRTCKFVLGIAFIICTNQFHLPKNRGESLKLKDSFNEMEHKFPFGTLRPREQDYFSRRSVALGNSQLERPEKSCSTSFSTAFPGTFCKW